MSSIYFFLKLFVFWLIYFLIARCFFIVNFLEKFSDFSLVEILKILPASFALDISFISYYSVVLVLILFINSFFINKRINLILSRLILVLNILLCIISSLIIGGEISLYREWETKLNFKALTHLSNPIEIISTATIQHYLILLCSLIITFIFIRLYILLIHQNFETKEYTIKQFFIKIVRLPFVLLFFLFFIRGGIQEIPINTSDAYFSEHMIINDVAVNPNWNIVQSIIKSKSNFKGNPYKKYSSDMAYDFLDSIHDIDDADEPIAVLDTNKPNIIFILLESWSADNIESLGGLEEITPSFKELEKDGLNFTNFYSNGWTSDQAMSSIFSSFPVFPNVAIINQIDKARKLPSLNRSLMQYGYHSSYFFGGQLTYGNIKGYLYAQDFDIVKDIEDFNHLNSGRLGVHDEYMFVQFHKELNMLPEPFMSTLFTLSSHSPFDFPGDHKLSFDSNEDKYVNSVAYTDKCLGAFFDNVQNETWFSNTLFVIVADHSHSSPMGWRLAQKERFKVPMLWLGEVLNKEYRGVQCDNLGSHIDIASTILAQLGIESTHYKYGFDILSNYKNAIVPYAFPIGYGLITNEGYYAFSEGYNRVLELELNDSTQVDRIIKNTNLYFQSAFEDYINY